MTNIDERAKFEKWASKFDEVARVMAEGMEPTYSDTYSSRELIEKALRALSANGYKIVRK